MKVAVVGAGLIGLGIAWRAAGCGLRVVVFDSNPQRAASRVGAGLLIPAGGRVSHENLLLRRASARLYPRFVAELEEQTGIDCGYNPCGLLTLCPSESAAEGLEGCLRGLGVEVQRLDRAACLQREPALSLPGPVGLVTQDHQVDPERLLAALRRGGELYGAELVEEEVIAVEPDSVSTAAARFSFDRVVVAAGAWAQALTGLPIFPVKGEVLHLAAPPGLLRGNLRVQGEDLYVANRGDGRLVVGSTEAEVGFDLEVTAVAELLARVRVYLPALQESQVLEGRAGLRPKVADGLPLLGELDGLLIAAGHHRNGILLTPITAAEITKLLLGAEINELIAPFAPGREIYDRRKMRQP